jgi:hypothetical protein
LLYPNHHISAWFIIGKLYKTGFIARWYSDIVKSISSIKTKWEIFSNFCGLLRISELYDEGKLTFKVDFSLDEFCKKMCCIILNPECKNIASNHINFGNLWTLRYPPNIDWTIVHYVHCRRSNSHGIASKSHDTWAVCVGVA